MTDDIKNSDFFKNLPEDVKEQLLKCKTEEEAMDILRDNMIEIPSDMLKKVAGGEIYVPEGCDLFGCYDFMM